MTTEMARTLRRLHDETRTALTDLCESRRYAALRDDLSSTTHLAASLLNQLRAAAGGSSMHGGAPGKTAPIPINPDAVDLLTTIRHGTDWLVHTANVTHQLRPAWHPPLVPPDPPTIETALRHVVAAAGRWTDPEAVAGITYTLQGWVTAITTLFDPPRRLHLARPCPACGKRMVLRTDTTGEDVQLPALLFDTDGPEDAWTCICQVCHTKWGPGRRYLEHLATVIDQIETERKTAAALRGDTLIVWLDGTGHPRHDAGSNMAIHHQLRHLPEEGSVA